MTVTTALDSETPKTGVKPPPQTLFVSTSMVKLGEMAVGVPLIVTTVPTVDAVIQDGLVTAVIAVALFTVNVALYGVPTVAVVAVITPAVGVGQTPAAITTVPPDKPVADAVVAPHASVALTNSAVVAAVVGVPPRVIVPPEKLCVIPDGKFVTVADVALSNVMEPEYAIPAVPPVGDTVELTVGV